MRIKLRCDIKDEGVVVKKDSIGAVIAHCSYENRGYFYLVEFPNISHAVLVKHEDVLVLDDKVQDDKKISNSKQIDEAEEEFLKMKKENRRRKKNDKK